MSTKDETIPSEFEVSEILISPSRGWFSLDLSDLWHYRELFYFLAWRDIKVRYKQTAFGAAWAFSINNN